MAATQTWRVSAQGVIFQYVSGKTARSTTALGCDIEVSFHWIRQTLGIPYNSVCLTYLPLTPQPFLGKAFHKHPHIPQSDSPGHLQLAQRLPADG